MQERSHEGRRRRCEWMQRHGPVPAVGEKMRGRERRGMRGGIKRNIEEKGEGGVPAVGRRRRGRPGPGGWRWLDLLLDRELRGGLGSGAMHGRLTSPSSSLSKRSMCRAVLWQMALVRWVWRMATSAEHDHRCCQIDGRILVVSAPDGLMLQRKKQILLALQVGVPSLVCFLNKVDAVEGEEVLELVTVELRELLSFYKFPAHDILIICGSAMSSLNGTNK